MAHHGRIDIKVRRRTLTDLHVRLHILFDGTRVSKHSSSCLMATSANLGMNWACILSENNFQIRAWFSMQNFSLHAAKGPVSAATASGTHISGEILNNSKWTLASLSQPSTLPDSLPENFLRQTSLFSPPAGALLSEDGADITEETADTADLCLER